MSTPAIVTGVDFVSVYSTDLVQAEQFYSGVLGLTRTVIYQRASQPPDGMEFETGSLTLSVVDSARMGITDAAPNKHAIALSVDDVEAARAQLEGRGVTFKANTLDTGVCHMALFEDPDGNALMLHERYAPRRPR